MDTTKGTGGDVLILEEAAYVDQGFFYETVAPLLIVGNTTLIGISTLRDEINFYTRLMRIRDKNTGLPMFTCMTIQLACEKCKDEGRAAECVHLLHLVPRWQSSMRHERIKKMMEDRPDLVQSELSGVAFESLQTVFRPADIETMLTQEPPEPELNATIYVFIDPAGGGPNSDYALLSFQRSKGLVTVSGPNHCPT